MSTAGRWESALLSPELVQIAAIALAGLGVGGIVYVIAMPYLGGERKASKRVATVAEGQARIRSRVGMQQQPLTMRKKQIQDTIKDIEAKQKASKRVPLRVKLMRAGLS